MNCDKNNDARKHLNDWLCDVDANINPLFDETSLEVKTVLERERRVLVRHEDTDKAIIKTVQDGLDQPDWLGFLYIMGHYAGRSSNNDLFCPLYVGKTGKEGRLNAINFNIVNIEGNKSVFARWGHGNDWHIGQLSNSLFTGNQNARHDNWAEELFIRPFYPPVLKQKIHLAIISWYDGVHQSPNGTTPLNLRDLERELIKLSRKCNPRLLNKQG